MVRYANLERKIGGLLELSFTLNTASVSRSLPQFSALGRILGFLPFCGYCGQWVSGEPT